MYVSEVQPEYANVTHAGDGERKRERGEGRGTEREREREGGREKEREDRGERTLILQVDSAHVCDILTSSITTEEWYLSLFVYHVYVLLGNFVSYLALAQTVMPQKAMK